MPIQNTFTLVPTAASIAGRSSANARPMTSKQVSKAYKAANRMPKMSRAERMKQERAEQERIRKEMEREKSAAKAKAARDKKKEAERAEKEERKRNGRPLVDVRASQNTMTSFFTRGPMQTKRSDLINQPLPQLEEADEDPDATIDEAAAQEESTKIPGASEEPIAAASESQSPPKQVLSELISDDLDDADFDLLLDAEDVHLDTFTAKDRPKPPEAQEVETNAREPMQEEPLVEPVRTETQYERDLGLNVAKKRKREEPTCKQSLDRNVQQRKPESPKQTVTSMAPPPLPPPPLSTQYIMCDFDDFFPTASQQVREIEELDILTPRQLSPMRATPNPTPRRVDEAVSPPKPPSAVASPLPAPKSPKRFFTASGSQESLSLALHRSRRTAALEAMQQKDRMRIEAGMLQQQQELLERRERAEQAKKLVRTEEKAVPPPRVPQHPPTEVVLATAIAEQQSPANETKENLSPQPVSEEPPAPFLNASQESEYGGHWLDELPLDIII
ncbi:hypothetical protein HJFPF1_07061 [Paramyrothecium foliicola]|nr:hypothetical protein HJFPF1_07061 [Paramyrothecium foliicola]